MCFPICAVLRYCERFVSHDTALRGMTALRTRLYETLATSRADVVAGLRRGDVLARVGADVDAVGDLVVRAWLPAAVAAGTGALTALAVGLIHPPVGLVFGACLLLAGIAGPLVRRQIGRANRCAYRKYKGWRNQYYTYTVNSRSIANGKTPGSF